MNKNIEDFNSPAGTFELDSLIELGYLKPGAVFYVIEPCTLEAGTFEIDNILGEWCCFSSEKDALNSARRWFADRETLAAGSGADSGLNVYAVKLEYCTPPEWLTYGNNYSIVNELAVISSKKGVKLLEG